jgi:Putative MetA-pathway of phenol degradation
MVSQDASPTTDQGRTGRSSPGRSRLPAVCVLGVIGASLSLPDRVLAGSARDYLNAPIDSWLAFYNSGYSASVTPEDGLDVAARIQTNVITQSVVLTRTMDYCGRTGGLSIVLPYLHVASSVGSNSSAVSGVSDIGFLWQMNIFGGPALTRQAFASFVPQTFSSFHLYVGTPLGDYEPSRALNPSANRWTIRPTVNFSYTPDRGWTWLETYASAAIFTPNDAFQTGGASRLTQNPLYIVEGHASRNITPRIWLSADAYYNVGGETNIDGVPQGNAADTLRLGGGMGASLWRGGDMTLNAESVVAKPPGEPNAWAVRLTLRQFW